MLSFPKIVKEDEEFDQEGKGIFFLFKNLNLYEERQKLPYEIERDIFEFIRQNDLASVQRLLQINPKIVLNALSILDRTVLHVAAMCGHFDMVRLLIKSGVNVAQTDRCGNTALHHALRALSAECLKVIYLAGNGESLINAKNKQGQTPLHILAIHQASTVKCEESFGFLIAYGACLFSKDNKKRSAIEIAKARGDGRCELFLKAIENRFQFSRSDKFETSRAPKLSHV